MIKRILVPIDGSKLSERTMQASIELAAQLGAGILGFAVERTRRWRGRLGGEDEGDADESTSADGTTADVRQVLAQFESRAAEAGVPYEGVCHRASRVDKAIIAAAESYGCDLILMVTRGRGAFGEFLFGSQTKAVLAGSRLPLLILK